MTQHEAAALLRQIAEQWERGEVVAGPAHTAVPELADMAVSLEAGPEDAKLVIEIGWKTEAARRLA